MPAVQPSSSKSSKSSSRRSSRSRSPHRAARERERPRLSPPAIRRAFVARPGFGAAGVPLSVDTNHWALRTLPMLTAHHHDVEVAVVGGAGHALSRKTMRAVIAAWEPQLRALRGAFDGARSLFCPAALPDAETTHTVVLPPRAQGRPPKTVHIIIRYVGSVSLSELAEFVAGTGPLTPNVLIGIQLLDIVFKQTASRTMVNYGRNFYSREERKIDIHGGLELWSGLFMSVRPGLNTLTLNVDTAYTAFLKPLPLIRFAQEVLGGGRLPRLGDPRSLRKIKQVLRRVQVRLTHRGPPGVLVTISGLEEKSAAEFMFDYNPPNGGDPKRISVAEYFQTMFHRPLQHATDLPLLQVRVGNRTSCIPFEVAVLEPEQRYMGKLTDESTASVIKVTAKRPLERLGHIKQLMGRLGLHADACLDAFHIDLGFQHQPEVPAPMRIHARTLRAPVLELGNKSVDPGRSDSSWNLIQAKLARGSVPFVSLGVLCLYTSSCSPREGEVRRWMDDLFAQMHKLGIPLDPAVPRRYPIHNAPVQVEIIEDSLRRLYIATREAFNKLAQMLFVLLPTQDKELYGEVKRVSDTCAHVPSQCLNIPKLYKAREQYWANVCLKLNVKVMGDSTNFSLQHPYTEPTMLMGADVSHPPPGSQASSIAALVGSLDPFRVGRYATRVRVQPALRTEIITDLLDMFKIIFRVHYDCNNQRFPVRLVFYRDGVSEGELEHVIDREVTPILTFLGEIKAPTRLTFVVVQKRHHTRFFATHPSQIDRSGNLRAGLVIDRDITHPTNYTFFLQSQAGLQGTSRPAYYYVVHDDNYFSPDDIQQLTFDLAFTYQRATRSVGVVPPVYYAHLACDRARFHLRRKEGTLSETSQVTAAAEGQPPEPNLDQLNDAITVNRELVTGSMYFM